MNSFEVYELYIALKQHFTSDYDFHKYNGKIKSNVKAFENRNDKVFFEKLSRRRDVKDFLLANLLVNKDAYIRTIATSKQAQDIYTDWLRRKESLTYLFGNECSVLTDDFNSYFETNGHNHPKLLRLYYTKKISLETLCILTDLTNCLKMWDSKLGNDPIYGEVSTLIKKYTPFIDYDKTRFKSIIKEKVLRV